MAHKRKTKPTAVVLCYCADRNDVWGREVAMDCNGVHNLAVARVRKPCQGVLKRFISNRIEDI